jgi:hypothetical protein
LFFDYLAKNDDPRIIFDVSFAKYDATGSSFRNYTQIINFEKSPEFKDPEYIMSLNFNEYLIESRNNVIKKAQKSNSFKQYEKFFDRVNIYLENIAHIAITKNTDIENYTYTSSTFIIDIESFEKTFDFNTLIEKYQPRSYFNVGDIFKIYVNSVKEFFILFERITFLGFFDDIISGFNKILIEVQTHNILGIFEFWRFFEVDNLSIISG